MADVLNPEQVENNPLNTELETPTLEAAADHTDSPIDTNHNTEATSANHAEPKAQAHTELAEDVDFGSMEDFAAALESFDREQAAEAAAQAFDDTTIVTGTVIKLTDKHVVVDVGLKSEGLIPLEQVLDHTGQPKLKAGDPVEVVIEREEPEGGYLLSYEKAQRHRVWDTIEKAANDKTPVTGMVVSRVKGGLTVDIGIKAFLPGSQLEIRPVRNLDAYIGQPIEVRVIKLNKKRGNVVVSRKEILEEEQNAKRSDTLEHLEEGTILTGTVKNLTDYGAFVDLGGIDGLLHITDMSWGRLTHPRDLVNVGDEIQVKVLKFDKDKQRVSLGFKQLTPDPWLDAVERYPVGARVRGRVLSVTDYGAFVELEQGIEGLVHVSEMTWSKRMKHPSKLVKPGDEVETVVLSVNPADRRISLGMKQLQENPWEHLADALPHRHHRRRPRPQPHRLRRLHRDRRRHRRPGPRQQPELDQARQASVRSSEEGRKGQGRRSRRRAGKPPPLARHQAAAARCLGDLLRAASRRRRGPRQGSAHRAVRRLRRDCRGRRGPLPRLRSSRRARRAGQARSRARSTSSRSSR